MGSLAALNQRRYRQRQREERAVYRIEAVTANLIEALFRSGRLDHRDVRRRDTVEMALSMIVEDWVRDQLR